MHHLITIALILVLAASLVHGAKGEWPMPAHDNRLSARAEVACDMASAPREVWSVDVGRTPINFARCADVDDDGQVEIIYGTSPLVCVDLQGKEKWRMGGGRVVAIGDLDGDGRTEIVTSNANVVDGHTGKVLWSRTGPGAVGDYRVHVGKLIPEVKGLQIACVSEQYEMNYAQVWSFAEGADKGKLVWEREFNKGPVYAHATSAAGRYDEDTMCVAAAVHGGLVAMDARDGKDLFRVYWHPHPGTEIVRNYGALAIQDLDGDGKSEFIILNDLIAVQLGVFSPARGSVGEASDQTKAWPAPDARYGGLASYPEGPIVWRRYFEYWYPDGKVTMHVPPTPIADVDGDGRPEIVVSMHRNNWRLHVYDAMTGEEKATAPGLYVHSVTDIDGDGIPEIIAAREKGRTPREFTDLEIGSVREGKWRKRAAFSGTRMDYTTFPLIPMGFAGRNADPREPVVVDKPGLALVLTRDTDGDGQAEELVVVQGQAGGTPAPREDRLQTRAVPLPAGPAMRVLAGHDDWLVTSGSDARMQRMSLSAQAIASWADGKPAYSNPIAADLEGDGKMAIVVPFADRTVRALAGPFVKGQPAQELWRTDGWGFAGFLCYGSSALCADVDGDGKKEVLVACVAEGGALGIKLLDSRGQVRWQAAIPGAVDTPLYGAIGKATFGDFNADGVLDVYVAARLAMTGNDASQSYAFNGQDGSLLWHNDGTDPLIYHHTLGPTGMPAVADVNGDGHDDVLFVTLDLCTEMSGKDGSFLSTPIIANTLWEQFGRNTQWTAYGTQLPVDLNGDGKLEMLQCSTWGQWGAWTLDRKVLWTSDPGREEHARRHPGIADVDGDGKLEIGVTHDGGMFRCYDAATGELKWELKTPGGFTDTIVADVDGDGLPEFVNSGSHLRAIKAVGPKEGKVLWEMPMPGTLTPIVADVDGDGRGEIVIGCGDGKLRVLK